LCAIDEEVNVDAITVPLELDDQQTICDVPSITINATSTDDVSYWWNTQDATASILVQSSGTYSVCVVDANGCENTETIDVVLDTNAPSLGISMTPEVTITLGNDYVIVLNLENTLPPYDDYGCAKTY